MAQLAKQLADTVVQVGVKSAYGDPIEVDGTTIIPVACASFGFGAGEEGTDAAAGAGGGGGGSALPLGAYVTRDGHTKFEPNLVALLAVGIPFVWVAGRALARVIRALKR